MKFAMESRSQRGGSGRFKITPDDDPKKSNIIDANILIQQQGPPAAAVKAAETPLLPRPAVGEQLQVDEPLPAVESEQKQEWGQLPEMEGQEEGESMPK